jgi:hypothetical protein
MQSAHDKLAKLTFSDVPRAAEELAFALGPGIAALIDWSSLRLEPTELVDEVLDRRFPDLRFTARLAGKEVVLNLVFEHQSKTDPWMPRRLFCHTGAIWNTGAKANEDAKSPLVVNVVLHNGQTPWSAPLALWSVIDGGELFLQHAPGLLPTLPMMIDDLAATSLEEIRARPQQAAVRLMLMLLKLARAGESAQVLAQEGELVRGTPEEVLREGLRYALSVDPRATPEGLRQALEPQLGTKAKELVMTGMQLIEQGRTEGLAKGLADGRAEGLAEGLAKGLADGVLELLKANGVHVFDVDRERILACKDLDQLRVWLVRAATASSVTELFATH